MARTDHHTTKYGNKPRRLRRDGRRPTDRRSKSRPSVGTSSRDLRPIALRRLEHGVIVHARIRFSDGTGEKCRPVVVIARRGESVVVAPITGTDWRRRGAIEILDWVESGLSKPSFVENRTVLLDRRFDIVGCAGRLSSRDVERLNDRRQLVGATA